MLTTSASPQTALTSPTQSERFYALDAVRAFALIIGIFFHGVMSIVSYIQPEGWIVHDKQHSVFLDAFFYVGHTFRMQAFFLIAGYFAHLLYHRRSANGFLQNRFQRIFLPLLVFWPILSLTNVMLKTWNDYLSEGEVHVATYWGKLEVTISEFFNFQQGIGLMHLWFLYFLALYCAVVFLIHPLLARLDSSGRLRTGVDKGLAYLMGKWWGGAVGSLFILIPMSDMKGWFGVDTPGKDLLPLWGPFVLYGLFFSFGWFLHRQPEVLNGFRKFRWQNLLISGVLVAALTAFFLNIVYSLPTQPKGPASDPTTIATTLLMLNSVYAFGSMTAVFAFIGFVLHFFSHPSKRIRYLSDAAYWLYIVHIPVLVFFQILVAPLSLHWLLKLPLIFVPSFAILFLTYHYGVRNTWLGVLLNGRRYPLK